MKINKPEILERSLQFRVGLREKYISESLEL
jgi:hypothetical protein